MRNSRDNISRLSRRRAFSFIEVLFAIILLGIGFILIAGVFPVAIQQTTAVSDETQGVLIARDAIRKVQALAAEQVAVAASNYTLFPSTLDTSGKPQVVTFAYPNSANPNNSNTGSPPEVTLQQALGNDIFNTADRRYGWVGFYRRDSVSSPLAQVFVIALENPNFPNYLTAATATTPSSPIPPPIPPNLYDAAAPTMQNAQPAAAATINATFYYDATAGSYVKLTYPSTDTGSPNGVTSAYMLVANITPPLGGTAVPTNMIGRFLRLGGAYPNFTATSTTQEFYLEPGWDFNPTEGAALNNTSANVFIIGAAPILNTVNPTPSNLVPANDYSGPFSGQNQDIAVASGFIRVNTNNN